MIKKHYKKFIKAIGNNKYFRSFLSILLVLIIKFIYKTGRFQHLGFENIKPFWQQNKPVIIAFWHSRIMLATFAWQNQKQPINALASLHRDGLILSNVLMKLGVKIINGSSFKNALKAALEIKQTLNRNESVAITPDGPRGPRMKLGMSVIYFAKKTGVPIIPLTVSANPCKIFNSWDRFMLVYPFAKGVFIYDEPFYVPKDCDDEAMEKLRTELEQRLINLQNRADEITKVKF